MQISNLNLGYHVRRDVLEPCGGARTALPCIDAQSLIVFPHDLKAFAIPHEHADSLAATYRRYLIASYIFNRSIIEANGFCDDMEQNEETLIYDRTTLVLIHKAFGIPFKEGAFNLDAAIGFVEEETNLSKILAIRWCMMMEYITFEDQRIDMLLKNDDCSNTHESCGVTGTPQMSGGGHDGV